MRKNSFGDHVDLFVRQHPSGTLSESRHRGSVYAIRHDFAHGAFIDDGEINRVGQRDRGASLPLPAVTARAIFGVERRKLRNLVSRDWF
jgi:hypothetical protein